MNTIHTREDWAKHLTAWADTGRPNLSPEALREIAAYLTAPVDFEFGGMKVGAHEEPCGGPCIEIVMPTGEMVQAWSTSTHNGRPRIQVWETTENFENCQEPDHDLNLPGGDE